MRTAPLLLEPLGCRSSAGVRSDDLPHFHLVHMVIQRTLRRWHGRLPGGLESGDLVSVGWLALHAAQRAYRPERGPFEPYAYLVIRRRVWAHIREHLSPIRIPSAAWYAARQGKDARTARAALQARRLRRQSPCLDALPGREDSQAHVEDRDEARECLARCGERERLILRAHHGLGEERPLTLAAIGQRLGLTRAGVSWIERQACRRLRRTLLPRQG